MREVSKRNEFAAFHPIVNFIYFTAVILFSMIFMHPVCLGISLISGIAYLFVLKGKAAVKYVFSFLLPVIVLTALVNPMFNHEGATVIRYLPSGNPLTAESMVYGVCAGSMLAAVICWFSCFNEIMTADKLVYLFGRISPSLSLIFSMTLRFVPRFKSEFVRVLNAQHGIGFGKDGVLNKIKCGVRVISIMITWSLENAVDTADSMRSRGYGTCRRTAFSIFRIDSRDVFMLIFLSVAVIHILIGSYQGVMKFYYYPIIVSSKMNLMSAAIFCVYAAVCLVPVIIELWEGRKWKY